MGRPKISQDLYQETGCTPWSGWSGLPTKRRHHRGQLFIILEKPNCDTRWEGRLQRNTSIIGGEFQIRSGLVSATACFLQRELIEHLYLSGLVAFFLAKFGIDTGKCTQGKSSKFAPHAQKVSLHHVVQDEDVVSSMSSLSLENHWYQLMALTLIVFTK